MPLVDLPSVPLDCEKSVMPSLEDLRYDSLLIASGLEARFSKKLVKLMEGKFGFFFFKLAPRKINFKYYFIFISIFCSRQK